MSDDSVATLNLEINTASCIDRLREADLAMDQTCHSAEALSGQVGNLGSTFQQVAVAMGAAMGGKKALDWFADGLREASYLREDIAQFEWIFRNVSEEGEKLIETLTGDHYGRTSRQAMQLTMNLMSMLKGMELTDVAAAHLSSEFGKMAVDIGSFLSKDPSDVMNAMQSAMMGNSMALRSYGVFLNEATLGAAKLRLAKEGMTFASEREEHAYAVLSEVMRQQADAVGDYNVEQQHYRGQMEKLAASMEKLRSIVGEEFLDTFESNLRSINEGLSEFLKYIGEMDPTTRKAVVVFGTLVPLVIAVGGAYKAGQAVLGIYRAKKMEAILASQSHGAAQQTETASTATGSSVSAGGIETRSRRKSRSRTVRRKPLRKPCSGSMSGRGR